MRPTRLPALLAVATGCAVLVYLALRPGYAALPRIPGAAPVSLALLSVVDGYLALAVRERRTGRLRVAPLVAARYLALAKASAVIGAAFAGGYVALLVRVSGELRARAPRHDAAVAVVGVAVALLLVAAALWLERGCRIPRADEDDEERRPGGSRR